MSIKILGTGCTNCSKLENLVKATLKDLNIETSVEKVSDMKDILKFTMTTPALVINEKLIHAGMPLISEEKLKSALAELK